MASLPYLVTTYDAVVLLIQVKFASTVQMYFILSIPAVMGS